MAVLDSLKAMGKHIGWVRLLNGHLKSTQVKREYDKTVSYYALLPPGGNLSSRLTEKSVSKIQTIAPGKRPRLFFMGTDELQDRGGILQALDRLADLTCFTRADGSYGQNHPGPASMRRQTNSERLLALFAELAVKQELPHILISQTWAGFVDPKVLGEIRDRYCVVIVNIGMDDRHQYWGRKVDGEWWGTRGLIPYLDLALTAAPECVDWYQKEGCSALFFPEASDPDIFHPMRGLPKLHEVCFVGSRYGVREKLVAGLQKSGVCVAAYGAGWDSGRLETKDVPRLFAQSKIVLGVGTIGHCEDFYALKMRDFDGPMSGSLYLTHANPDLDLLYRVGQDIVTYTSIDDCIDKAKWFLQHDDERERIAQSGRVRASTNHTWDKRFADLFDTLRRDQSSPGTFSRPQ